MAALAAANGVLTDGGIDTADLPTANEPSLQMNLAVEDQRRTSVEKDYNYADYDDIAAKGRRSARPPASTVFPPDTGAMADRMSLKVLVTP